MNIPDVAVACFVWTGGARNYVFEPWLTDIANDLVDKVASPHIAVAIDTEDRGSTVAHVTATDVTCVAEGEKWIDAAKMFPQFLKEYKTSAFIMGIFAAFGAISAYAQVTRP